MLAPCNPFRLSISFPSCKPRLRMPRWLNLRAAVSHSPFHRTSSSSQKFKRLSVNPLRKLARRCRRGSDDATDIYVFSARERSFEGVDTVSDDWRQARMPGDRTSQRRRSTAGTQNATEDKSSSSGSGESNRPTANSSNTAINETQTWYPEKILKRVSDFKEEPPAEQPTPAVPAISLHAVRSLSPPPRRKAVPRDPASVHSAHAKRLATTPKVEEEEYRRRDSAPMLPDFEW